jgi:hypothetical protein
MTREETELLAKHILFPYELDARVHAELVTRISANLYWAAKHGTVPRRIVPHDDDNPGGSPETNKVRKAGSDQA